MSLFKRIEQRAFTTSSAARWEADVEASAHSIVSGPISPHRARMMAAVWACQSLIADGIASLPIDTYRKTRTPGKKIHVDNPTWIDNPNPFDTPYNFWHKVMISLLGEDGNAFIFTPRDANKKILAAYAIDPWIVQVDELSPVPHYLIAGEDFTDQEIIHIPAFTRPGWRRGLSIIDYAREAIGLGLAAEEFGARFFSQGTTMTGVVEHPGKPSPGEVAVLAKMLKKSHAGIKNSHAVGVLTGGSSWKSISITPDQAQFLETRRFQNTQIGQLYRVPPHMVDPTVTSTWGTGIEEQNRAYVDFTLIPWIVRLEQTISRFLPGGQYIKFNVDAMLRGKQAERYKAYLQAISSGIMNPDEARALEDLEPIPGGKGQLHFIPANLIELGSKPPAPTAPSTPDAAGAGAGTGDTQDTTGSGDAPLTDAGNSDTSG